jgi:cystathionine beta-synthase
MIGAAEKDGRLKPGGVIVEATAGNTGLGLAEVAVPKGYRLILVVPDKMAREKILHLRALGVEVRLTRSDVHKGHPDYYQDIAEAIARDTPGSIFINQFSNPANPAAHQQHTGPEIWEQLDQDVDAVVVGVGSGGTLTGLGRFFREVSPKTQMILADPEGSVLAPLVQTGQMPDHVGSWAIEGIGGDVVPANCDLSLVSKAYSIGDEESIEVARDLLREEGVLAGSSTGTLLAAALRWCREQTSPKRVVTLACDRGDKYLTKVYNDLWVAAQGYTDRAPAGDVSDLIAKRYGEGGVETVRPEDTLLTAYNRMRSSDISQLPVVEDGRLVGIVDESDILSAVEGHAAGREGGFACEVRTAMTSKLHTLEAHAPLSELKPIFDRNEVAVVMDGSEFVGVITRVDLINHLRLTGG